MVPLVTCSIIAVTVIFERLMTVRAALSDTTGLSRKVEDYLYNGKADKAIALCEITQCPVASVMAAGISNSRFGVDGAERAMVDQATKEMNTLTVRLPWLDTIITIAPLLGLLGTVTGMIRSFHVISSKAGIGTPTAITGGVAEALIATATGLAIAIVSLVFYNALNEKIKQIISNMESAGTQITNVLSDIREQRDEVKILSA